MNKDRNTCTKTQFMKTFTSPKQKETNKHSYESTYSYLQKRDES